MPRIFDSTEPQAGDDLNTILAKRLQSLGGTSRWGATDEEIQAELSKISASTAVQTQTQFDQLGSDTDKVATAVALLPASLKPTAAGAAGTDGAEGVGGIDWTLRQGVGLTGHPWVGIAHGNGVFVAVSGDSGGHIVSSSDGINWTHHTSATSTLWGAVTFGQGKFYAFSIGGEINSSPDGVVWTALATPSPARHWKSAVYGAGRFVVVGSSGATTGFSLVSTDGINWTSQSMAGVPTDHIVTAVTYGNGTFVAVCDNGSASGTVALYSTDGINWTASGAMAAQTWVSVAYGNGIFVAVNEELTASAIATSPDGVTWTSQTADASLTWRCVTFGNGLFSAVARTSGGVVQILTSPDGINWTPRPGPVINQDFLAITYGSGLFVSPQGFGNGGRYLVSGDYVSAEIIPAARRIDWTGTVGVKNGIPTRNTIYQTLSLDNTGATNVGPAIQTALDNCPSSQVVYLPAGTYRVDAQLLITNPNITFRGAGMGQTIIKGQTNNGGAQWGIVKFQSGLLTGATNAIDISSGATKNSTGLVLANSDSNLHTGYIVYVDQLNGSGGIVDNNGVDGARTDADSRANGTRCNSQQVKITNIVGGTAVSFEPKLVWDFTATPQLFYRRSTSGSVNYLALSGIEDMTLQRVSPLNSANVGQHNLVFYYCDECWAKNVETLDANTSHIATFRSYRLEIRGCTCRRSTWALSGGGYGIDIEYQTCSSLIEDNIFDHTRDFVKLDAGSVGNVVSYNYHSYASPRSDAPTYVVATGGSHSAHPMMNLWEGNITYTPRFDFTWGSSSHFTLLRNWFRGPMSYAAGTGGALKIDQKASFYNVVGNVLGTSAQRTNPNYPTKRSLAVAPTAVGNPLYSTLRIGYRSDDQVTSGYDGDGQWRNTIAAGNFDYIAGASGQQVWYNPAVAVTIPDSYYYTSKPGFFGALAWPPVSPAAPTVGEQVIPAGYRFAHGLVPAQLLVDFENGSEGATVTPTILGNASHGSLGTWQTTTDPENRVEGTTSLLTITTNASSALFNAAASVGGTTYPGSGTRGMRATLSGNNCAQLTLASPYSTSMSVGFFFRFNGPAINDSPRDLVFFQDIGGNFQILQIYDHTGSTSPIFHAHTQTGVGNNVNFSRNKWYWVSIFRTAAGGLMKVNFYDPANSFSLVGSSTKDVPSGTSGVRWFWFGCSKYSSGGSQTVDYDNLIINTNGLFPLGPFSSDGGGTNP